MSVSNNINSIFNVDNEIFHVSGSSIPINLEVVNGDNLPLSECVSLESNLIKTFPENILLNDCGCPINECDNASLKITIKKINPPKPECFVDSFSLGGDGLVLFVINGESTQHIASECCTKLGFVSEINDKGISVCRWGVEPSICEGYVEFNRSNEFVLFLDPNGLETFEVPSSECCPLDTIPDYQTNGMYKCSLPVENNLCEYFY